MQLAVDIGNTRIKYCLFKDAVIIDSGHSDGNVIELVKELFDAKPDISSVIVSSVHKEGTAELISLLSNKQSVVLSSKTKLPFNNLYKTPETLGNDRIALVAAAVSLFPSSNSLIIDAGTCLTMDLVNAENEYLGGTISPGVRMRFTSMHKGTARLPFIDDVDLKIPPQIGASTVECMSSGVLNGMIHEIKGTINDLKMKFNDLNVLLTGGDHHLFENELKSDIFADPNLVLRGLRFILQFNLDQK